MLYDYNGNFLFSTYIDNGNRAKMKGFATYFPLT